MAADTAVKATKHLLSCASHSFHEQILIFVCLFGAAEETMSCYVDQADLKCIVFLHQPL